ncbi:dephospho-CoA kinase [Thermogutta terrifontis]|nr:dephospho-CoA kinase [Thermogutta terrifontis]
MSSMITVGLLGPPATGKSLVATEFARLGAEVFDADEAAHRVLDQPAIRAYLGQVFGSPVFPLMGEIDRKRIAELVFEDNELSRERRRILERVIHEAVLADCLSEQEKHRQNQRPVFVIDAPLLLEAGWSKLCQRLLYIDTPTDIRYHRAGTRGWKPEELDRRERWLISRNVKKVRADFVIDNSGSINDIRQQVTDVWRSLIADLASH